MYKFTVITPTLNSENGILRCIKSVFDDQYENYEHIIIDGGSTDNTVKIIEKNTSNKVKLINAEGSSIYSAINIGIKNTTGDVISVLGSSDYYNTNFRFKFLNDIFKSINTDIIYGDVAYFSKFNQNKIIRKYKSDKFSKEKIAWGFMPAHQSMYIKKKIYDLAGNYDETYKIAGDYELIARIYNSLEIKDFYLDKVLTFMEEGGVSNRNLSTLFLLNKEVLKACHQNNYDTNYFKIYSKYFSKIIEYIARKV